MATIPVVLEQPTGRSSMCYAAEQAIRFRPHRGGAMTMNDNVGQILDSNSRLIAASSHSLKFYSPSRVSGEQLE